MTLLQETSRAVGRRVPRVDGPEKVTGSAMFTGDYEFEDMLHVKILRSPYAHAIIKKIETKRAEEADGVRGVLSIHDVPHIPFNAAGLPEAPARIEDQYIFDSKVRFVGDRVAAVAALGVDRAQAALELIDVDYEALPAVFDPEKAMQPGAPLIHKAMRNIADHSQHIVGSVAKGLKEAYAVAEGRFTTGRQQHTYLEPNAYIVCPEAAGRLTVYSSTQVPFFVKRLMAQAIGIDSERIRVVQPYVGGAYGGKEELYDEPILALLATRTGKPVKLQYTREETFIATRTRHPCTIEMKIGARRDGTLTTIDATCFGSTGAYASHGPAVIAETGSRIYQLYRCPNIRYDGYCVYTNVPVAGAFRGYGNPQASFAREALMDELAETLNVDPIELRVKNAFKAGEIDPATGFTIRTTGLRECLERGSERAQWTQHRTRPRSSERFRRGTGVACASHSSGILPFGSEVSSAVVKINEDGTINVIVSATESGQGILTALAQIAAEEAGVPAEEVKITNLVDTDVTPFDHGNYGSRSVYVVGSAVKLATADAKKQLLDTASGLMQVPADDLIIVDKKIQSKRGSASSLSISEVIRKSQLNSASVGSITGRATYSPSGNAPSFAAQFVEAEVDTWTGRVRIVRVVAAHDVGRAINPTSVEGQIQGALQIGLGFALTEDLQIDEDSGVAINANLMDYKTLTSVDMPPV
ncbi:MAG TPA: molybdopterin cofactor-binding domain-containing protein, partial [Candidatus Acidoferrales bacterium]|nr:molybdopterin cofactor-binding domain-containing protein [Candidatus Acidoferrales bacterium]